MTGDAWERLPEPRPRLTLEVCAPDGTRSVNIASARIRRVCDRKMSSSCTSFGSKLRADPKYAGAHHYHIVALALEELQRELTTEQRAQLLQKLQDEVNRPNQQ